MNACLDGVHEEDRPIVRNVVSGIQVIKKDPVFSTWSCAYEKGHYIVTAYVNDKDCEFSTRELEMLHDISPLRVVSVSICRQGQVICLKVRISDHNEPLILTETQVVHVRKRARWSK